MKAFKAEALPFRYLEKNEQIVFKTYPYLRSARGEEAMYCVSPHHGRSFVVGKEGDRFVVSKGNGLSYSQYSFLNTGEYGDYTWGELLIADARRDYLLGMEIRSLGIKTNIMECVIELDRELMLTNGHIIKPVLLQYTVECPYRICDAAYMSRDEIINQVSRWEKFIRGDSCQDAYLIAANVMIRNLRVLHDNGVLHNAIHFQNYTWALELLDFELSCSPRHPYSDGEDQEKVKDLLPREILQTYEVINHVAWVLGESIDYHKVDDMFVRYGFDVLPFVLR